MPPEFGADPAQAEQALRDWADGLRDKAQRFTEVRRQLDATRITESGRSVTVTVDAQQFRRRFHGRRRGEPGRLGADAYGQICAFRERGWEKDDIWYP